MPTKENNVHTDLVTNKIIDINKDDIANIAIAEAELKIKRTIADLKSQLAIVKKSIADEKQKLGEEGESLVRKSAFVKVEAFEKTLYDLNKKKKWNFSVKLNVNFPVNHKVVLSDPHEEKTASTLNTYEIHLEFNDPANQISSAMLIEKGTIKIFAAQISIAKSIESLQEQYDALVEESLKWRQRLADIPAMERQIRAAIAKRQISQTKEGQELIKSLLKSLDSDIKMLGI